MSTEEISRMFVELPSFRVRWKELGLNDSDLIRLETELLSNPKIGNAIQGTGGVRKLRFAFENRGKSGSVRVIYVDFELYERIFLITAYAKSNKENLSQKERNEVKDLVEILEFDLEKGAWRNVSE